MTTLSGVWLPIVTPFHGGVVDFVSYEKLIEHYIAAGISGIFPLGTTGESPTLDDDESEALIERMLGVVAGRLPVFVGIGGNSTATLNLISANHWGVRLDGGGANGKPPFRRSRC